MRRALRKLRRVAMRIVVRIRKNAELEVEINELIQSDRIALRALIP
jgi:hypothetical protein